MTTTDTDVQQTVMDLNAGWYNVVKQALNISEPSFLLAQGNLGLQTSDSSGLFLMADATPPSAAVAYFDPGSMQRRSQAYGGLLGALLPETGSGLPQVLGDQYANWITYKNAYTWPTGAGQPTTQQELFEQWANRALDPRTASQAVNVFKQAANCELNTAIDALHAPGAQQTFVNTAGQAYSLYPYTCTVDVAKAAIATGKGASISFDSTTMNSSLETTTVHGSASGFYDIFAGEASADFSSLNKKAAGSEWSIQGTIGSYATVAVQTAGSWYDGNEVSRAYNAEDDNTIWDPMANAGSWHSFFDADTGSLARHVSQLVLVSDYELTVTSYADYSSEDLTTIKTQAEFGVWPFFAASGSATHEKDVKVGDESELVVTYTLNKGLIEIWGVTTLDAPK